jgi:hypothetical protein
MNSKLTTVHSFEIWHKDHNLSKKHNMHDVPQESAVFGVFGIVNEEPVNCRYIGETDNLRDSIVSLFEHPESEGMKKFMQGPWIQMLQYELMPGSSRNDRLKVASEWTQRFNPKIDEDGEYPGYYA